jgi:hypothetical protein
MAQSVASLANPAGLRSGGFKRKKPGFLRTELPVDQQCWPRPIREVG